MAEHKITATGRKDEGKGASRRLRHAEQIPAILYGGHADPKSIQLEHEKIDRLLRWYEPFLRFFSTEAPIGLLKLHERGNADIGLGRDTGIEHRRDVGTRLDDRGLGALARAARPRQQDDALACVHDAEPSPVRSTPSSSNTLRMSSTSWYGLPR